MHAAAFAVTQQVGPRAGRLAVAIGQRDEFLGAVHTHADEHEQAQFLLVEADAHMVRSDRSAVPVSQPTRFCGPPPEPDVRLVDASGSPQAPDGLWSLLHAVLGHGDGICAPRYR